MTLLLRVRVTIAAPHTNALRHILSCQYFRTLHQCTSYSKYIREDVEFHFRYAVPTLCPRALPPAFPPLTFSCLSRETLAIPVVGLGAGSLRTRRWSSPANSTTLSIQSGAAATTGSARRGRRHDSAQGRWGRVAAAVVAATRASNGPGSRDRIGPASIRGLARRIVDAQQDTGVGGRVGTGEADGVARAGVGAGSGDADLGAFHIELGTVAAGSTVEGEKLDAHQVVARRDAGWHGEVVPAVVGDEAVNGPGGSSEAILCDLEPA